MVRWRPVLFFDSPLTVRPMFRYLPLGICLATVVAFMWAVQHDAFFWDTVQLASKHAHYFYQHGLAWSPLPAEIDSGHPPFLGWYLALIWTFFGKNLAVSHWAMLPFLLANVWLLFRLGLRIGGQQWVWWLLPLALLDPVLAGQSALVSPDVVLTTWFLLAVEGILGKRRWWVTWAVVGLCTVSMRGMMTAAALAMWSLALDFWLLPNVRQRPTVVSLFNSLLPLLPGALLGAAFLVWHWKVTGWVGHHAGSPWASAFVRAEGWGFLKNAAVIGWRWTDMGRWAEWIVLAWAVWSGRANWRLLSLLLLIIVFLSPSALLYANLSAHRYFLPLFLALHLVVFEQIVAAWPSFRHLVISPRVNSQRSTVVLALLIISLATGNLWIYPRGVSMDWDSTLAHLPYHALRSEAMSFLEEQKIDVQSVGSAFPNLNTGENLLLNGDQRRFAPLDFESNQFVLASNVFNDINEPDYLRLEREWVLVKKWRHPVGVWMVLYQRKP